MEEELLALKENDTWDIVSCPSNVRLIGCKWVYSINLHSDGTLDRYKARLVVLGNRQEYGVDYEETFTPVAKMTTVRTIIAIAASQNWSLYQMDVKNAFLHGDLKEDIYMKPPLGLFSSPTSDVCKLKRSLYGLKQAPRAWFDKFRSTLLQFSFEQSKYDSSLFLRKTSTGCVLLLVYVDDIIITGTDSSLITCLQQQLKDSFHMKDLGTLTYFLGLEVHNVASGVFLNQHKYTQDLISLAGLQVSSSVDTPLEMNVKYRREEGDLLPDPTIFRQLVGSLNYLTITRPDISFAVQQVSQFMQAPRHLHLVAVRRIIRYLLGTSTRGLFFPSGSPIRLNAFSDSDWAGCPDTRRSVSGWCMFLGESLISWKSKKQDRVSKSSTEAEYRSMSTACSEVVWLRGLLAEIGFPQSHPTPLHADNTSAIQIATNPVFHERTKHIEVDCHYIREAVDKGVITLPHVSSDLQIADAFTKSMARQRHQFLEKLPNLQVLILKSNLFHGPIGDLESEFPFPELRISDLSCNGFTGTLSSNLFNSFRGMMDVDEEKTASTSTSTNTDYLYHVSLVIKGNEFDMRITSIMTSVDLSRNRFEGDIPNSIGSLSSLVLLNLSHNSFRGPIPAELAQLQQLEALDLSWNRLIGEIPGLLSSLTFLEVLNLSYNHLAGRIPIGKQFNTFPNDSYCGNPDLCGFPLSKECGNNNESPLEHDDDDDDSFFMSGFTWEAVVIGYGCGMIFGLLIGGLMFLLEKPKWYVNFAEDIAQQIAAKKRTRQKKRRQRRMH
ncbi:hypothetical protein KY285_033814 [Solanum tuberosum]|nr:hypothetical protein KY285_033814 [Solanum tuberosum]